MSVTKAHLSAVCPPFTAQPVPSLDEIIQEVHREWLRQSYRPTPGKATPYGTPVPALTPQQQITDYVHPLVAETMQATVHFSSLLLPGTRAEWSGQDDDAARHYEEAFGFGGV
jgi:hypothetical protein